ncbi:MAG: hypothetical protein EOP21_03210 [Hyphomicrobiales bacterium]|nr:MAG: hypothetical protein EOP21_03210 [Hyphomicrobiales bacterium]
MAVFLSYRMQTGNAISTCFTARDALARHEALTLAGAEVISICDDGRHITLSELREQILPSYIPPRPRP